MERSIESLMDSKKEIEEELRTLSAMAEERRYAVRTISDVTADYTFQQQFAPETYDEILDFNFRESDKERLERELGLDPASERELEAAVQKARRSKETAGGKGWDPFKDPRYERRLKKYPRLLRVRMEALKEDLKVVNDRLEKELNVRMDRSFEQPVEGVYDLLI